MDTKTLTKANTLLSSINTLKEEQRKLKESYEASKTHQRPFYVKFSKETNTVNLSNISEETEKGIYDLLYNELDSKIKALEEEFKKL